MSTSRSYRFTLAERDSSTTSTEESGSTEAVWSLWRRDKSLVPAGNRAKSVAIPTELNEKSYGICL
jgi:chitodextrinase